MITAMPRIAIAMRDFDAAIRLFRDALGMPVLDFSDRTVPTLGAHVGMCMRAGGRNMELMAPSDPDQPLSQSLLKFLDRRGDGLYALMLEAPDPDRARALVRAAAGGDCGGRVVCRFDGSGSGRVGFGAAGGAGGDSVAVRSHVDLPGAWAGDDGWRRGGTQPVFLAPAG